MTTFNSITAGLVAAALGTSAVALPAGSPGTGRWRNVPGPAVPAGSFANLTALGMAGPSLGWASGFTLANSPQHAQFKPLLAAWNGRRWRAIPVSLGAAGGRLDGLAVRSATDAWAVGTVRPTSTPQTDQPLTVHWNGHLWARVPAAGVPGRMASLEGVAAQSPSNAWAVGQEEDLATGTVRPLVEHWDGRRWRLARAPEVGPLVALTSVAVAGGQAWATGFPFAGSHRPIVLHWTGRTWKVAATPWSRRAVFLMDVTAVRKDDVWAVGWTNLAGSLRQAYALHWDGHRWNATAVPHRGQGLHHRQFESVAAIGGGRMIAVGAAQGVTGGPLYGLWNGRAWSVSHGPLTPGNANLNAVAFDGHHAIWAVGCVVPPQHLGGPVVQVNR